MKDDTRKRLRSAAYRLRVAASILGPTIKDVAGHMDGARAFNCWDRIAELEALGDELMQLANEPGA